MGRFHLAGLMISFAIIFILFLMLDKYGQFIFMSLGFVFSLFVFIFYILHFDKRPQKAAESSYPDISVIIPCYDAEKVIAKTIESAIALKYPGKKEVIVVDDASKDSSVDVIKEFDGVKLLKQEKNKGKAAALNFGVGHCCGDYVLFIDADTILPDDLLLRAMPHVQGEKFGATTFAIMAADPKSIWERMQEIEYFITFGLPSYLLDKFGGVVCAQGATAIYNKKALLDAGGFDETNMTEDFEMTLRLIDKGYKIRYLPITVHTSVQKDFKGLLRQRLRWHRGGIYNLYKYRHLIFDRSKSDTGIFAIPALALMIFFMIAGFFFMATRTMLFAQKIGIGLYGWIFYGTDIFALSLDPYFIRADIILFSSLFLVFLYWVVQSTKMLKIPFGWDKIRVFILMNFIYPLIVSFFYAYSLYLELAREERKW